MRSEYIKSLLLNACVFKATSLHSCEETPIIRRNINYIHPQQKGSYDFILSVQVTPA